MANYKRGKCRYNGRTRRNSETFYRRRVGLVPVRLTKEHWKLDWSAWRLLWIPRSHNHGKKIGGPFSMMNGEPRWHTIIEHNRRQRAKVRTATRKALKDEIDAEEAIWPLAKKPHIYYW